MRYHGETRRTRHAVTWGRETTMRARLFRTIDIIAALTNVSLDQSCSREVDELIRYVTGHPFRPKKGSRTRREAVAAIRSQLPNGISGFGVSDLIKVITQINKGQHEDQLKAGVVQILEDRYGQEMTLSPEGDLEAPTAGLRLLRSLAEHPDTAIIRE